jgi:hypothetical protein
MVHYHISLFQRYGIFCIWIIAQASCGLITKMEMATNTILQRVVDKPPDSVKILMNQLGDHPECLFYH